MSGDLSGLPRHITLRVGERAEVPLPSYAGSGNSWSAIRLSDSGVADVSVEFTEASPPPSASLTDGTAEPPPLFLVPERAVVSALAPGKARWQLVLARPFASSPPTAVHEFQVTVLPQ
jgi:hypothetical protein